MDKLNEKLNKVKSDFAEICIWFGYAKQSLSTKTIPTLFGSLNTFIKSIVRLWESYDNKEKEAFLADKKTEALRNIKQTTPGSLEKDRTPRTRGGKIGDGENPFDELANKIKLGNINPRELFK
eukprot:TRINITY_DN10926_c0_g1_i1.p1 TRINITY_DN10926_c0_g1~~TRINITY_DN10926_c0_g1_i1.p1  ORF type:complete len:137 (-),score=25.02 TRINITY_DN10926_c0_g1_i1:15-383(-)